MCCKVGYRCEAFFQIPVDGSIREWLLFRGIVEGHDIEHARQSPAVMTAFVQNLLQQMRNRFQTMSNSIISKVDEMGGRINDLEQSIKELRAEMGMEGSPSSSVPTREKSPLREFNLKEENS